MYSFESRVRYSEVDETGALSLVGMVDYLQDCSTFQSEDGGVGPDHLAQTQLGWFIANWEIQIDRMPRFGDRIVVSTWSYNIAKLYGWRNYTITSPDGREYVRADSLWFLFDKARGRAIKVPQEEAAPYLAQREERLDMPPIERKISVEGAGRLMPAITVNEQHLDMNRHVNNAQYIQMAVDAVAASGEVLHPRQLNVQYKKAAVVGIPLCRTCMTLRAAAWWTWWTGRARRSPS